MKINNVSIHELTNPGQLHVATSNADIVVVSGPPKSGKTLSLQFWLDSKLQECFVQNDDTRVFEFLCVVEEPILWYNAIATSYRHQGIMYTDYKGIYGFNGICGFTGSDSRVRLTLLTLPEIRDFKGVDFDYAVFDAGIPKEHIAGSLYADIAGYMNNRRAQTGYETQIAFAHRAWSDYVKAYPDSIFQSNRTIECVQLPKLKEKNSDSDKAIELSTLKEVVNRMKRGVFGLYSEDYCRIYGEAMDDFAKELEKL